MRQRPPNKGPLSHSPVHSPAVAGAVGQEADETGPCQINLRDPASRAGDSRGSLKAWTLLREPGFCLSRRRTSTARPLFMTTPAALTECQPGRRQFAPGGSAATSCWHRLRCCCLGASVRPASALTRSARYTGRAGLRRYAGLAVAYRPRSHGQGSCAGRGRSLIWHRSLWSSSGRVSAAPGMPGGRGGTRIARPWSGWPNRARCAGPGSPPGTASPRRTWPRTGRIWPAGAGSLMRC